MSTPRKGSSRRGARERKIVERFGGRSRTPGLLPARLESPIGFIHPAEVPELTCFSIQVSHSSPKKGLGRKRKPPFDDEEGFESVSADEVDHESDDDFETGRPRASRNSGTTTRGKDRGGAPKGGGRKRTKTRSDGEEAGAEPVKEPAKKGRKPKVDEGQGAEFKIEEDNGLFSRFFPAIA
jgi:hypothetical protein